MLCTVLFYLNISYGSTKKLLNLFILLSIYNVIYGANPNPDPNQQNQSDIVKFLNPVKKESIPCIICCSTCYCCCILCLKCCTNILCEGAKDEKKK